MADFITFLLPALIIIGITLFAGYKVWDSASDKLVTLDAVTESTEFDRVNSSLIQTTQTFNMFDFILPVLLFGFYLAILASIAFLDTSPWFLIVFVILFGVVIVMGMVISDIMTTTIEDGFASEQPAFPITYHLMDKLPFYLFGMLFIFGLVLYGVKRNESIG